MVSVVMPAYNAARTVGQSIESVISQTYTDWELIVIDDCSADATAEIVQGYADADRRIRLYRSEKNAGVSQSRNLGVSYAKGDWAAFLDSDDLWDRDKLKKQVRFNGETGADISYTGTAYINEAGAASGYVLRAGRKLTYKELLKRNIMSCSSVMVRRKIAERVPFPAGYLSEDYAVWLRILRETGCARGLDEPLLLYRVSGTSKSGSRVRSGKMTYNAYRQVGYGVITSLMLTLRYSLHSVTKRARVVIGMKGERR